MRGTVRGKHFQHPAYAEIKMIRWLRGKVWDVAVDLRANYPTFLQWYVWELRGDDSQVVTIPEGFAEGFQAMETDSELLDLNTGFYERGSEGGLRHDDPRLAITWPLSPQDLSPPDLAHLLRGSDFAGVAP